MMTPQFELIEEKIYKVLGKEVFVYHGYFHLYYTSTSFDFYL